MKINLCLPYNASAIWFKKDFTHPVNVADSWERLVIDSTALYEKEIASLVGLNLLCASIRNYKHFRSLDEFERFHISAVLKLFCKYVRNFVYVEGETNDRNS